MTECTHPRSKGAKRCKSCSAKHMARGKIDQDRARAKAAKDRAKTADPAAA